MLTGAFSSGLDWLYPLRVVAAAWVLWIFRRHYTHLGWSLSWRAVAIGIVTFGTWLVLVPAGPTARDGWPAALEAAPIHWAAAWLLFRVVGYTITAPLVEELAFRAYLTRRLMGPEVERFRLASSRGRPLRFRPCSSACCTAPSGSPAPSPAWRSPLRSISAARWATPSWPTPRRTVLSRCTSWRRVGGRCGHDAARPS